MPKSKRDRKVALTKTSKKGGLEFKQGIIDKIRKSVDEHSHVFVFAVDNMRNNHLKAVREAWKGDSGRSADFFLGKNRVMGVALGREEAEEYCEGLHQVSRLLRGPNRGLMVTNESEQKVLKFFRGHEEPDFARTGGVATETFTIPEGPLPQFGHAMEPQLRALGLPTTLKKGVICLLKEHTVCRAGDKLTSEQARILKLFGHKQASFTVSLVAVWSKVNGGEDTEFKMLDSSKVYGGSAEEGDDAIQVDDEDDDDDDKDDAESDGSD